MADLGWASVSPYAETEVEGVTLVLCHYPFRSWNGMHGGAVNLHGHSHGRLKPLLRQFDVGVDVRDAACSDFATFGEALVGSNEGDQWHRARADWTPQCASSKGGEHPK